MCHLQHDMYDARLVAIEMRGVARTVQCECATDAHIHLPALFLIDRVFSVTEGRIFVFRILRITIATEDNGAPTQQERQLLIEAIVNYGIKETPGFACPVVEELTIIVSCTG